MKKISIQTGEIRLEAELNDSETARIIYDLLPITGSANVWGDEIYFSIPAHIEQSQDAKQEVEVGDMAFWPAGDAFCIFFGPTPVSINEMPRAYSPVNVFGRITGDAILLKEVRNGADIKVSKEL
jgi:hypothetical protein